MAANRKLGCLSVFLFVALCASLFVNLLLIATAFQRLGGIREPEAIPRFREILLERGARATSDKIAQRNIAWVDGPNPGVVESRRMPHPFEIRPSSPQASALDELMVLWGDTPGK